MKKIMMIVCLMCAVPAVAFDKAKCTDVKGEIHTARDKTEYCVSPFTMNWWSAFAWCQAIGGELIDYTEECFTVKSNSQCPNLSSNIFFDKWSWVRNPVSSEKAFRVANGVVGDSSRNSSNHALCK